MQSLWAGTRKRKKAKSMKQWRREEKGRGLGMRKRGSRLSYLPYSPRLVRAGEAPECRSRGRREMTRTSLVFCYCFGPWRGLPNRG